MNVLKEAIQRLRMHLGKDAIGISLLDAVTLIANEQRTRNATLAEASATDREAAKTSRAALVAAQNQIAGLREDLAKESSLRAAAQLRERAALAQVEKPEVLEKMENLDLERRMRALLRNVQRRFKKLPVREKGRGGHLILEDFVQNYTYDEFAGLGMVISACAVMNMPIRTLIADRTFTEIRSLPKGYDPENDTDLARFVHWYRDCVHFSSVEATVCDHMNLPKE